MTTRVKTSKFTLPGLRLVATMIIAGCLAVVFSVPAPVLPTEPPTLVVTRSEDARERAEDVRRAARLPRSPEVDALLGAIERAGARELGQLPRRIPLAEEAEAIAAARAALVARHGADALDALRASLALRAERLLARADAPEGRDALVLGGFRTALETWRVSIDRRVVSAGLLVRAMYKARLAVVMRTPPTEGLRPRELRAYHGWLGLHARAADPELRREAALAFARESHDAAGAEALAFALFAAGEDASACTAYARAHERTGSVRLRNHTRACLLQAH